MSGKGITAYTLTRKSNVIQIEATVKNLSKAIDDNIEKAHAMGLSEIRYELPEHFSVANLERKDAQLVIYGNLIEEYEKKGFIVDLNTEHTLRIRWKNILNEEDRDRLNDIIKSHIVTSFDKAKNTNIPRKAQRSHRDE